MSTSFPSALDTFLSVADNPPMNASGRTATQVVGQLQAALAAVQAVIGVAGSSVAGTVEKRLADLLAAIDSPAVVSATAPTDPEEGAIWLDTSGTPVLKVWVSGSPGAWVVAGGGAGARAITVGWDAGTVNGIDQPLTTGRRVELRAVTGLTPVAWTLLPKAGSTGSITVEVRKRPFSSGTFTAITAGSPPSISSGARGTASASAWTAIDDGDLIEMEVTSVTGTVTGITLIIEATEA